MKWYQQLVHHDIWDYDIAAAPVLIDVRRNGQVIPAVAQQTKMALMFIFNRETGEPIFGIEERPVPQTTAPGEWTSPTQPFPVKPPPLARNSLKQSELSKVTPEHQAFCEGLWDKYKLQRRGAVRSVASRTEHRRVPRRAGRRQLARRDVQQAARAHHHERHDGRAVGPSRRRRPPRRRRAAPDGRAEPRGSAPPAPRRQAGCQPGVFPPALSQADARRRPLLGSARSGGAAPSRRGASSSRSTRTPATSRGACRSASSRSSRRRASTPARRAPAARSPPPATSCSSARRSTATSARSTRATARCSGRDKLPGAVAIARRRTYMGRDGKQYVVIGANGGGFFGARRPTRSSRTG